LKGRKIERNRGEFDDGERGNSIETMGTKLRKMTFFHMASMKEALSRVFLKRGVQGNAN